MHGKLQLKSNANRKLLFLSFFPVVPARQLWEGVIGSQYKIVGVNMGTRGLFTTAFLMGGAD